MIDGGRNLVEVELVIVPFHYLIVAAQNLDAMFMKKFLYIYFMEMYFYLSNIIWGSFVTLQCHAAGPVFFFFNKTHQNLYERRIKAYLGKPKLLYNYWNRHN